MYTEDSEVAHISELEWSCRVVYQSSSTPAVSEAVVLYLSFSFRFHHNTIGNVF